MKAINIGLLGFGTVGTGVARILIENKDILSSRIGADLVLKRVADIDLETDRGVRLADGVLVNDAFGVTDDPDIDIIIESIGGEGIAKTLILRAVSNGKQVVTANKALIAAHGNEILAAAAEQGVDVFFEASVGGCMPVIKTLRESLAGNRISDMSGILNGTCNYILTKITEEGSEFEDALAEAQAEGYAEADPTLDVGGFDAAHKLAIVNALAYGMTVNLKDIYVEGITRITPMDIDFARQFDYRIKLLAISKNRGDAVEARVHPTMIPAEAMLAKVGGPVNAFMITGDAVGDIMLYGYGAGMMPTASAVVSDLTDLARNLLTGSVGRVPTLGCRRAAVRDVPVMSIDEIHTQYYLRFMALDRPGVLSKISGILGNYRISLKSVHQKGRKSDGAVPIVMMTHLAKEADVKKALAEIARLDVVEGDPVVIRVEDKEEQE